MKTESDESRARPGAPADRIRPFERNDEDRTEANGDQGGQEEARPAETLPRCALHVVREYEERRGRRNDGLDELWLPRPRVNDESLEGRHRAESDEDALVAGPFGV